MKPDIRLNQKTLYITAGVIFVVATIVPVYLWFHLHKVGITRYLTLSGLAYFIAAVFILGECLYYQKLKKALVLPLVDGKIFSKVSERWTKHGVFAKCMIDLNFLGRNYRFIIDGEFKNILEGATVRVLFNEKDPPKSIIIRENRYLKITRSTLKDN